MPAQIIHTHDEQLELITNSRRPRFRANAREDEPAINSILLRREWEALDNAVVRSYRINLQVVADMRAAGMTSSTTLAEMLSSWRVASERRRPDVNMDGRTRVDRDRTDRKTFSVPLPILATAYEFGTRELMASRAVGAALDTFEAEEAAQALAEEEERLVLNGNDNIIVQGNQLYGLTNHPDRLTDTAGNYGGGDFGTEGNGFSAIKGAIQALYDARYYGDFNIYMAHTQYTELMSYHTDGSGDLELNRIERLPRVNAIKPVDLLPAGEVLIMQMDYGVADIRTAMGLTNRQWDAPDGSAEFFKVMEAMTIRIKPDYRGNVGILHMTGA